MTLSIKAAVAVGISALLLGASVGTADAMPVAPASATVHAGTSVETVAYMHRHYPGYYSKSARKYRYVRRNSINKYCQSQPSRCH